MPKHITKTFNGVILTETSHSPNEILRIQDQPNRNFCFALQGGWKEIIKTKEYHFGGDTLIYYPRKEFREIIFNADTISKIFTLDLTNAWLKKLSGLDIGFLNKRFLFSFSKVNDLFLELYEEFIIDDDFSSIAIEGICCKILAEMSRLTPGRQAEMENHWLENIKLYIEKNYKQEKNLKELAKSVNKNPSQLHRNTALSSGLKNNNRFMFINVVHHLYRIPKPLF